MPWPPSYISLAGYLCHHVERNNGSTKSVQNALAQLRVHARKTGRSWLREADAYRLKRTIAALVYEDVTPSRAKLPATLDVLERVVRSLDMTSLWERAMATSLLLGHNALLRGGELHSGLRVRDLSWDSKNKEVLLKIARSKTHRSGPPIEVAVRRYPGCNAYDMLRDWLRVSGVGDHPEAFIFPRVMVKSGRCLLDHSRPMDRRWWNKKLGLVFSAAGYERGGYSGHSLRAGGATDLFTAGVPYPAIKKAGRWASEAALRYFRQRDYVASEVAMAFGRRTRELHDERARGAGEVVRGTRMLRKAVATNAITTRI